MLASKAFAGAGSQELDSDFNSVLMVFQNSFSTHQLRAMSAIPKRQAGLCCRENQNLHLNSAGTHPAFQLLYSALHAFLVVTTLLWLVIRNSLCHRNSMRAQRLKKIASWRHHGLSGSWVQAPVLRLISKVTTFKALLHLLHGAHTDCKWIASRSQRWR